MDPDKSSSMVSATMDGEIFSPLSLTLSSAATVSLKELIQNKAGKDPSEVINKLLTAVLQEFRTQHTSLLQVQTGNRNLSTYVHELEKELAVLRTNLNPSTTSSSSSLLSDDNEDLDDNEDGSDMNKRSSTRKRFFKGLNDLDPSGT